MVDHRKIQDKWQRKWKKEKVFEVNVDKKKRSFLLIYLILTFLVLYILDMEELLLKQMSMLDT